MKLPTLKEIVTAGTIGLAGLGVTAGNAEAQFNSGVVEYVQPRENSEALGRVQGFYGLPGDVSGFSFMEFYKNGNGYFGKTYLDKPVLGRIGPRIEVDHVGEPFSYVGAGISTTIPGMPEGGFARVGILPLWRDKNGNMVKNKTMIQYSFGASLPWNMRVGGFGEWNISSPDGLQWGYGEFELVKNFGDMKVGFNPVLWNDEDAIPEFENRLIIGVNF